MLGREDDTREIRVLECMSELELTLLYFLGRLVQAVERCRFVQVQKYRSEESTERHL